MFEAYQNCQLCPRECNAARLSGEKGFCGADGTLRVARAALHFWEEPCLSGEEGSGTVFFSGCGLRCVFCQNYEISSECAGKAISWERLSAIFLELQEKGANNINLVTPTQYVPEIRMALSQAREEGLRIPIVYNSSGYEKVETLQMLSGMVDIWLPDFKYMDGKYALRYSGAEDYFPVACKALDEMVCQAGEAVFDAQGRMLRGVIVRHLLLPGLLEDSKAVIRYLYERYGDRIYLSLMNQYTPLPRVAQWPEIACKLSDADYEEAIDYAISLGLENGFIQEGGTAEESFIPAFDNEGV